MEIVADSSPLISCARAGKLKLISDVYLRIIIPPSVYSEVVIQGAGRPGADEIQAAVSLWVEVKEPQDRDFVNRLEQRLGPGESEALALAKELDAFLLADERKVIYEARNCGVRVKSTLLMLLEAKDRSLIVSVGRELDELIASGFRCSDALYRKALALSDEF